MNQIICKPFFFFFLMLFNYTLAQIKGICIDENGKAIPYVNISIKGKEIGTVSNEKGEFTLDSKKIFNTDRLLFSHIGFNSFDVLVPKITKKIILLEKNELLEEINREGTSILMASHNYNLIKGRGHRIIEIQNGVVRKS